MHAVALKTGELQDAIWALKEWRWGWGIVFARVIFVHLDEHPEILDGIDAIIPMPMHGDSAKPRKGDDHAGWVIEQAIEQDEGRFPFILDPPLIIKTGATPRMRDTKSAAECRAVADELYRVLRVPDPAKVAGKGILVYDDVFTGGNTLDAIARRLREAGATSVSGLALARQTWRS